MGLTRRGFLAGAIAGLFAPATIGRARELIAGRDLVIPQLIEAGQSGKAELIAQVSKHEFVEGVGAPCFGYHKGCLGPTLKVQRGTTARINVKNAFYEEVIAHWHGLHIDGAMDGGPHSPIAQGDIFEARLDVDQPASTFWYHSHIEGKTGVQVYGGLAGMLIVDDPVAGPSGLPETYGVDNLPIIIQDKAFSPDGHLTYENQGPFMMMGFRSESIFVNGTHRPTAHVGRGLTRLLLLNASNACIYHLSFSDNRAFHQVGTDGGLLPAPVEIRRLTLGPAERVDILVDFSSGQTVKLVSAPDTNSPMGSKGGGFMGRMMGGMMGYAAVDPELTESHGRFEAVNLH